MSAILLSLSSPSLQSIYTSCRLFGSFPSCPVSIKFSIPSFYIIRPINFNCLIQILCIRVSPFPIYGLNRRACIRKKHCFYPVLHCCFTCIHSSRPNLSFEIDFILISLILCTRTHIDTYTLAVTLLLYMFH